MQITVTMATSQKRSLPRWYWWQTMKGWHRAKCSSSEEQPLSQRILHVCSACTAPVSSTSSTSDFPVFLPPYACQTCYSCCSLLVLPPPFICVLLWAAQICLLSPCLRSYWPHGVVACGGARSHGTGMSVAFPKGRVSTLHSRFI